MIHPIELLIRSARENNILLKIEYTDSKLMITFGDVCFDGSCAPFNAAIENFIEAQLGKRQYGWSVEKL